MGERRELQAPQNRLSNNLEESHASSAEGTHDEEKQIEGDRSQEHEHFMVGQESSFLHRQNHTTLRNRLPQVQANVAFYARMANVQDDSQETTGNASDVAAAYWSQNLMSNPLFNSQILQRALANNSTIVIPQQQSLLPQLETSGLLSPTINLGSQQPSNNLASRNLIPMAQRLYPVVWNLQPFGNFQATSMGAGLAPDIAISTTSTPGSPLQFQAPLPRDPSRQATACSYSEGATILTHRQPVPLFLDADEDTLSEYQCLLRKQIELFEASQDDIQRSAQGRNTPISLGQVGIRCRHCAVAGNLSTVQLRGSIYFSQTIDGIYQIAQNMSKVHFCGRCPRTPEPVKRRLSELRSLNQRAPGGKAYWTAAVKALGVYEDGRILRFLPLTQFRQNPSSEVLSPP